MLFETITLTPTAATLTAYACVDMGDCHTAPRRAVVICPGGGYSMLSEREAEPIAKPFLAAGLNVFILRYTVGDGARDYQPLIQVSLAIKHIRENSEEYNVDPEQIFIIGFSAGGHLAASTGILWKTDAVQKALGASAEDPTEIGKPNGILLSYPVITSGEFAHKRSFFFLIINP